MASRVLLRRLASRQLHAIGWTRACAAKPEKLESGVGLHALIASQSAASWARTLSSSSEGAEPGDPIKAKFVRFFALLMLAAAGMRVAPWAAAAMVGHAVALLDAREPFMVRAGMSRLQSLVGLDAARRRAVEEGAVGKLLVLVAQPGADPEVVGGALALLVRLTESEDGLLALFKAEGSAVLYAYVSRTPRAPQTEDALFNARRMLAALEAEISVNSLLRRCASRAMTAAGAGAKGGDRPPFLAALDEGAPERFYRPSSDPSFPALADATVVAGGRHLPVHSQFLAAVSPVLCQAFAGQAEGRTRAGNKRKRDVATPFSGFSLQDVCAFLRFAYSPHEATPANLVGCGDSLPALLRLAHQLQADRLLECVDDTISAKARRLLLGQLAGCINAADACQLEEMADAAVSSLVSRLQASVALSKADVLAVTSQLGSQPLAVLVGGLATGPKRKGSFSWTVQQFSSLEGEVGSPSFFAGGVEWQLVLYPTGEGSGEGMHLSLYLNCLSSGALPLKATYTLTVRDAEAGLDDSGTMTDHTFTMENNNYGWSTFMTLEQLRSPARGHLQGDALRVSAQVQVL
eukprot:scaffold4.g4868.t1